MKYEFILNRRNELKISEIFDYILNISMEEKRVRKDKKK